MLLALVQAAGAAPEVYDVEPALTSTEFAVSHLGMSRQRGHFARTRGTIVLDPERHSGNIVFAVDAASIDTGWNARDEFLRGEDMFDAAHYPVVRFRSTQLVFAQGRAARVRQGTRRWTRRLRRRRGDLDQAL